MSHVNASMSVYNYIEGGVDFFEITGIPAPLANPWPTNPKTTKDSQGPAPNSQL